MTQPEYDAFLARTIPEYAADNVRAGYWAEAEALERSRNEFARLLPQGLQTPEHYLYTVHADEVPVGMVWLKANLDRPTKSGFIFELYINESQRGQGFGKQAMLLIEEQARELGLQSLGLHVFAVNAVARKLYETVGYETSSLNMTKKLT
jgi:ribosomal protein S18 acetylase RimI-like enzyme